MKGKPCHLCDQQASLYCPSDSAFLCSDCDAAVHGANFIVARHLRHLLCSKCNRFAGIHISRHLSSTCTSCSPDNSSHSTCVSSSESCATKTAEKRKSCVTDDASPAGKKRRRNVGSVAEEVFEKWGIELGLGLNANRVASHALSLCLGKWNLLPFRVAAATSFWLGLRFCGDRDLATCQNLERLEAISGVPAKLILHTHANLTRVFTHRGQLQEGWDES